MTASVYDIFMTCCIRISGVVVSYLFLRYFSEQNNVYWKTVLCCKKQGLLRNYVRCGFLLAKPWTLIVIGCQV